MNFAFLYSSWVFLSLMTMIPSVIICLLILWFVRRVVSSAVLKKITTSPDLHLASNVRNKNIHINAKTVMDQIWNAYYAITPGDQKTWVWYRQSIEKLSRQFNSWAHLSTMMWTLLIVGAAITICFMFFFGLQNIRSQMLMTALLAGYLSFMLYLVFSLDHVFKGPEAIKPSALQEVITLFDRWDQPLQQR